MSRSAILIVCFICILRRCDAILQPILRQGFVNSTLGQNKRKGEKAGDFSIVLPVELTRYLEFVTIAIPTAYEDEDSSISTLKELNHPYLTGSPHSTIIRAVAERE